jgi:hypothetical protein
MTNDQRITFIIGNGLGMALDPNHFRLESGMAYAWNRCARHTKKLLKNINKGNILSSETELIDIQKLLFSIRTLNTYAATYSFSNLLRKNGVKFYEDFNKYVLDVSHFFYDYNKDMPDQYKLFINHLSQFIVENPVHIAVLNYDKLIYESLLNKGGIFGKMGECRLLDGMHATGFKEENLVRTYYDFGWYLHLHGSPLFYSDMATQKILKDKRDEYCPNDRNKYRHHLVLTHSEFKLDIINQSLLLEIYWKYFCKALNESKSIVLFGYSGNDSHINQVIANQLRKRDVKLFIIEYCNEESEEKNRSKWKDKLDLTNEFKFFHYREHNILMFDFIKLML